MSETVRHHATLADRLTHAEVAKLLEILWDQGADHLNIKEMLADPENAKAAISTLNNLRMERKRRENPPAFSERYQIEVPSHLGDRIYRKAFHVVNGWYPGINMRVVEQALSTAALLGRLEVALVSTDCTSFHVDRIQGVLSGHGLKPATLEQLAVFCVSRPDIADHYKIMAAGTRSTSVDGFEHCYPVASTSYTDCKPYRVLDLSLDSVGSEEQILLLGIISSS